MSAYYHVKTNHDINLVDSRTHRRFTVPKGTEGFAQSADLLSAVDLDEPVYVNALLSGYGSCMVSMGDLDYYISRGEVPYGEMV